MLELLEAKSKISPAAVNLLSVYQLQARISIGKDIHRHRREHHISVKIAHRLVSVVAQRKQYTRHNDGRRTPPSLRQHTRGANGQLLIARSPRPRAPPRPHASLRPRVRLPAATARAAARLLPQANFARKRQIVELLGEPSVVHLLRVLGPLLAAPLARSIVTDATAPRELIEKVFECWRVMVKCEDSFERDVSLEARARAYRAPLDEVCLSACASARVCLCACVVRPTPAVPP